MTEARRTGSRRGRPRVLGARDAALTVLTDVVVGDAPASAALETALRASSLRPADVGLTHELVLGVLRHRLTLEAIVRHFFRGDGSRLQKELRLILCLAIYQLCWLERVPDFAAVNEAVEQAKRIIGRNAGGLVNAVLRAMLRSRGPRALRGADRSPQRWLAIDGDTGFEFSEPLWPDPETARVEYLSTTTSHPTWIVKRWMVRFGLERARELCQLGMRRPPLVLRPNRMRIDGAGLARRLVDAGVSARVDPDCEAVEVADGGSVAELAVFREGLCQPQDATAQSVWDLRRPRSGECVLDLCAGAGTKATHAAEWMNDEGCMIACDIDAERLRRLSANAERLGLSCIRTAPVARLEEAIRALPRPPNVILVDAPCTNSGVFARRPDARYRMDDAALLRLVKLQGELLDRAARFAGPESDILYSTCSIEPEENEGVVEAFGRRHAVWTLAESRSTLPSAGDEAHVWRDGGFAARLSRGIR
ncbi:MAG: hypothetical protein L6Q92_08090 [Phycisphaerae bacterium]|nr:hypothetical protein [Phycisphaerae bacterium]